MAEEAVELAGGEFVLAVVLAFGVEAGFEELPGADAGEFYGVLEGEEYAQAGADFGVEGEEVLAVVDGLAGGDGVVGASGEDVGEGAFAGAVGAHNGVDFAGADLEVDAVEDGEVAGGGVEVLDLE